MTPAAAVKKIAKVAKKLPYSLSYPVDEWTKTRNFIKNSYPVCDFRSGFGFITRVAMTAENFEIYPEISLVQVKKT
jgi:pterin-4a-carbinolamine dehydratase